MRSRFEKYLSSKEDTRERISFSLVPVDPVESDISSHNHIVSLCLWHPVTATTTFQLVLWYPTSSHREKEKIQSNHGLPQSNPVRQPNHWVEKNSGWNEEEDLSPLKLSCIWLLCLTLLIPLLLPHQPTAFSQLKIIIYYNIGMKSPTNQLHCNRLIELNPSLELRCSVKWNKNENEAKQG